MHVYIIDAIYADMPWNWNIIEHTHTLAHKHSSVQLLYESDLICLPLKLMHRVPMFFGTHFDGLETAILPHFV